MGVRLASINAAVRQQTIDTSVIDQRYSVQHFTMAQCTVDKSLDKVLNTHQGKAAACGLLIGLVRTI